MTKEEFIDWKNDSRTMEVMAHLLAHKYASYEAMSDPSILGMTNVALQQARYIGYIEGLNAALEFTVEEEKENDDSTEGTYDSTGTQDSD